MVVALAATEGSNWGVGVEVDVGLVSFSSSSLRSLQAGANPKAAAARTPPAIETKLRRDVLGAGLSLRQSVIVGV